MNNYVQIKQSLEKLYNLLDTVEENGGKPSSLKVRLRMVFKTELHTYFMYLSAVDGRITGEERSFMNYLFDMNLSNQEYVKFINDNDIYSTDFENKVPVTLQILTAFDQKTQILAELTGNSIEPITPLFLKFYVEAGKVFIACDGIDANEINELTNYIKGVVDKLSERLDGNTNKIENDEVAFVGKKKMRTPISNSVAGPSTTRNRKYGPSIYKVGVDIPAGEYKVYPEGGRGYFAICRDANCDQIIRNDNFCGQAYINISNGQFLDLTRCYAIPVSEAPVYKVDNRVYEPGEYKVGVEIPAGEYRLIATEGARGYYAIEKALSNGDREIISNDNFQNAAYVDIRNGQILQLVRCYIRL